MTFNQTAHRKMWDKLIQNPGMRRLHAFKETITELGLEDTCEALNTLKAYQSFVCGYTFCNGVRCDICPLDQDVGDYKEYSTCSRNYFLEWNNANNLLQNYDKPFRPEVQEYIKQGGTVQGLKMVCSMYARAIRNYPVRDNIVCK